jgi:hypothetical protein
MLERMLEELMEVVWADILRVFAKGGYSYAVPC